MEEVFFYAQILSVKTVIGQNKLTVKLRLNTLFRLAEIYIIPFEYPHHIPFEYIKFDRPISRFRAHVSSQLWRGRKWEEIRVCFSRVVVRIRTEKKA